MLLLDIKHSEKGKQEEKTMFQSKLQSIEEELNLTEDPHFTREEYPEVKECVRQLWTIITLKMQLYDRR